MKFGALINQQSVPEWSPHNIDYNEIKERIKLRTSKDDRSISIPGAEQPDHAAAGLEDEMYELLRCEHERTGRFVSCKLGECQRRLLHQRRALEKAQKSKSDTPRTVLKRLKKLTTTENAILRVGQDLQNLCRFVAVNRLAIIKLLKKYRKWTDSPILDIRVRRDFFEQSGCFTKRNVKQVQSDQSTLLAETRSAISKIPECSSTEQSSIGSTNGPNGAKSMLLPKARSEQKQVLPPQPDTARATYWNEYEDGSEFGDEAEPYTISYYPDNPAPFPGTATLARLGRALSSPFRSPATPHFKPNPQSQIPHPDEETALLLPPGTTGTSTPSSTSPTEVDSPPHILIQAPTILRPPRPAKLRYYSNFPRYSYYPPPKEQAYRDYVLFWASVCAFSVSALLLGLIAVFAGSGRRKLAMRVHVATLLGVVFELVLALAGVMCQLARRGGVYWAERIGCLVVFVAICAGSGITISGLVGLGAL